MPSSSNLSSRAPVRSRFQLILERLLAYSLVISPPIAGAVTVVLLIRHRARLRQIWRESWTLGVFALLGALGMISAFLTESQRAAIQGLAGMLGLFIAWLLGWMTVEHPKRFWRDLQRGIGIVALITVAWTLRPFTLQFSTGALTIPIAVPHDPVAVFGLGANGLGILLAFGGVLAFGRMIDEGGLAGRTEAFFIAAAALAGALMIGARNALLGASVGAVMFLTARGLLALVAVIAIAGITIWLRPEIGSSFLALAQPATEQPRIITWGAAVAMIRDHPLVGVGPFNFGIFKPRYVQPNPGGADPLFGPHSIYLRMAAEWGIPAAVALFTWLFSWPIRLWERRMEIWRWSFVAALVAYLVMGVFDDPLFTMHVSAPVFAGIVLAVADLRRHPSA